MSRTAVLVMMLAASLALAPLRHTVLKPINSIGIGDIIDEIIRDLGQLIDR